MSKRLMISIGLVAAIVTGFYLYRIYRPSSQRLFKFRSWMINPSAHPEWKMTAGTRCGQAPFIFPTDGLVGFLWGDSFGPRRQHQGLDIFGGQEVGVTPVVAAYPGFLTRLPDWISTVIVRIPSDPLQPGHQIWTYYTHMADRNGDSYISEEFPAGIFEIAIDAGTFLGYQGNFSGDPLNPTGIHLHFSVVKDDGQGNFRNELEIKNTLDPSPYFELPLNGNKNLDTVPICEP